VMPPSPAVTLVACRMVSTPLLILTLLPLRVLPW